MHFDRTRSCPRAGRIWAALALALLARSADGGSCHPKRLPLDAVLASWYGAEHHGRRTASGEVFDERRLTAAHPTLPLSTMVRVTNLVNGLSVLVRISDRGPGYGRGIDLSEAAAIAIGMRSCGLAPVRITAVPSGDGLPHAGK